MAASFVHIQGFQVLHHISTGLLYSHPWSFEAFQDQVALASGNILQEYLVKNRTA
jgi:hypothetical protein